MTKYQYHYFQFPLCLLQKVHEDCSEGFNIIINYSLVNFANKLPNEPPYDVEEYQRKWWDEADKLDVTAKILGVTLGSKKYLHAGHKEAMEFINNKAAIWGTYPTPGIKTDFIFDVKNKKNKMEAELIAGLIGIKSLIGQRKYTATYKNVIVCRMLGCKRKDELEQTLRGNLILKAVYDTYSKRFHIDKLLNTLIARKFLRSKIAYGRQIFLSDELNYEELTAAIVEKRKTKDFKSQERQSRETIKRMLNDKK